jgi:hypothetical protein
MAIATRGLVVLDPTTEPVVEQAERAERPTTLEGKTVGFLDNSKRNSDKMLMYLDELLRERHGITGSLHRRKPTSSRVVPAEILDEMAGQCDVIVPGIGD